MRGERAIAASSNGRPAASYDSCRKRNKPDHHTVWVHKNIGDRSGYDFRHTAACLASSSTAEANTCAGQKRIAREARINRQPAPILVRIDLALGFGQLEILLEDRDEVVRILRGGDDPA